jgi:septal ring factor EnvC (AmiA/AmiB activator)
MGREADLDRAEQELEEERAPLLGGDVERRPRSNGTGDLDDDVANPVSAWLERRKRRQASLDSREASLAKREDDIRRLEERLASVESSLQRKEADLTAFAEMLQQSLSRAEAAATDQARTRRPADEDPTQRLRFWTRDSAAGGGNKGNNAA